MLLGQILRYTLGVVIEMTTNDLAVTALNLKTHDLAFDTAYVASITDIYLIGAEL